MDLLEQGFGCTVSICNVTECLALHDEWLVLQEKSHQSCFLNWNWISAWLNTSSDITTQFVVVRATQNDKTIGLAIFSTKSKRTFYGKSLKQLWLNRTGCETKDQVWIEHNDFLVASSDSANIRKLMFNSLLAQTDLWDEIFIGLSPLHVTNAFQQEHHFTRELISSPSFDADISKYATLSDYLQSLSKNTRSQINRSKRGLESLGELELSLAQTESDKKQYLSEISALHIEKWGPTIHGSGFNNPIFVDFHQNILINDQSNQYTRLYRLRHNGKSLGYVYLLINSNTWSFYLSAIEFHEDPKIKVGLLLHSMIIEQAIAVGVKTYDFLAGEAQYKKSLSNTLATEQKLVCFYRPTFYMLIREQLRKLKNLYHHHQSST